MYVAPRGGSCTQTRSSSQVQAGPSSAELFLGSPGGKGDDGVC